MSKLKTCFVVPTQAEAHRLQKIIGDDWMVIAAGSAVLGHHFSAIIVSNSCFAMAKLSGHEPPEEGIPHYRLDDWLEDLKCRKVDKTTPFIYV